LVAEFGDKPYPPTVLELLGRPPHPLLAFGVKSSDLAWPAERKPVARISRGGQWYTPSQLVEQERVEDAAAEWQSRHEEEVGSWPQLPDVDLWW
jgi:hypothetical protein